ncbi:MAG: hypothetical protein KGJ13_09950 [Patescibacteria group bacterium]|nr:hypothetical protein [Patescibacteria group bacterium]
MKHQAINLVKFKALSRALGQPMCVTVGVLESLWIFAQIQARDGDLTPYSASEIAGWIEYPGDEEKLIDSLIKTGWLDATEDGQILIHDWHEHKPNWLKAIDARSEQPSQLPDKEPNKEPSAPPGTELGSIPPNNLKPKTQPNPKASSTGVLLGDADAPPKTAAKIPYQEILKLYHEILPMCPKVSRLTEPRRAAIRARWHEELPDLDTVREYFVFVRKSDFLTGNVEPAPGRRRRFVADIDWLMNPTNLVKVEEGKYHGKGI